MTEKKYTSMDCVEGKMGEADKGEDGLSWRRQIGYRFGLSYFSYIDEGESRIKGDCTHHVLVCTCGAVATSTSISKSRDLLHSRVL